MSKQTELTKIAQEIISENICPALAKGAKQLVPGSGNPDADVMLVGEAPGKSEDEQGKPFVGAAGRFLEEMLATINLTRKDVFITNIVKYRPPNNRDPKLEEIEMFMPYLFKQVEIIKPFLIATLGRFSMNVFLPSLKISQAHGQPKRKAGQVYLPLYHPAAALYNGGMRKTLISDFKKIPQILEMIKQEKTKV